jgi:hypothetical protein
LIAQALPSIEYRTSLQIDLEDSLVSFEDHSWVHLKVLV